MIFHAAVTADLATRAATDMFVAVRCQPCRLHRSSAGTSVGRVATELTLAEPSSHQMRRRTGAEQQSRRQQEGREGIDDQYRPDHQVEVEASKSASRFEQPYVRTSRYQAARHR